MKKQSSSATSPPSSNCAPARPSLSSSLATHPLFASPSLSVCFLSARLLPFKPIKLTMNRRLLYAFQDPGPPLLWQQRMFLSTNLNPKDKLPSASRVCSAKKPLSRASESASDTDLRDLQIELGTACGKLFRCSTMAILDAGDSDILSSTAAQ